VSKYGITVNNKFERIWTIKLGLNPICRYTFFVWPLIINVSNGGLIGKPNWYSEDL
jgi:hypothetical protein